MPNFALRLDVIGDTQELFSNISAWLSEVAESWLVVRENLENNDHTHMFIVSEKTIKAIRSSLVRRFKSHVGNEAYSLKQCAADYADYVQYMCKGAGEEFLPEVVSHQGLDYEPEQIAALHAAYWDRDAELNARKRARLEKSCKGSIVEQVEAACKRSKVAAYDRKGIALEYIRLYKAKRKGISIFHAKSVVNTVSLLLDDGVDNEEMLAADIAARC